MASEGTSQQGRWRLGRLFGGNPVIEGEGEKTGPARWSMGILNDLETVEVPGESMITQIFQLHHC